MLFFYVSSIYMLIQPYKTCGLIKLLFGFRLHGIIKFKDDLLKSVSFVSCLVTSLICKTSSLVTNFLELQLTIDYFDQFHPDSKE